MSIRSAGLILSLLLILAVSCSKRTTERRKNSLDSLSEASGTKSYVDTSQSGSYTRFIGYFPVLKLKTGQAPFQSYKFPGVVLHQISSDSSRWSPADFVEYLKMLDSMDSIPELAPFYYERWTSEKKGVSTTADTTSRIEVKKTAQEKITEKKPNVFWKFGVALIVFAVILIVIFSPKKPKQ